MKMVFRKVLFFSLAQITIVNGRYRHSNNKHTGNRHELIFVRNIGQYIENSVRSKQIIIKVYVLSVQNLVMIRDTRIGN